MRPAQYASSSANIPLNPEQMTAMSPPWARPRSATARRLSSDPSRTTSQRSTAVRIARVPFVVVRINVRAFAPSANSRGEAPTSKPSIRDGLSLAADDCVAAQLGTQRARVVDLLAAEHALVPRRQRLGDRGGRADDVDDDPQCRRRLLIRGEGDVNTHADTLAAWTNRATATGIRTAKRGSRAPNADARSATSA